MSSSLPDKLFFRIGEVAELVGVKPHVLRYWESEFACLRPMKTRGAHRQYRRRDVELAMLIKQLLHDERYTVSGARKRLRELGHDRAAPLETETERGHRELRLRATLLAIRAQLGELLGSLDAIRDEAAADESSPKEVTVHSAVPSSVPIVRRDGRR